MTPTVRVAAACCIAAAACTPEPLRPTYVFEAAYGDAIVTPAGLRHDVADYAGTICGDGSYRVLDRAFVGEHGPQHVRVTFACR